ncbi:MAG: PEP-CTERM sorting domain-containing protein [Myxococcota bacterium]
MLLLIAMPAEATIITGGFSMAGGLAPGQDFSGPGTVNVDPQSMIVLPGTIVGDFASYLSPFQVGSHKDIPYEPFAPIDDLWTVTGFLLPGRFAFGLDTLNIDFQSATQLDLSGTGAITHPDFDDTPFEWAATFQSLSLTASFSASTQEIPEPTTGLLLGLGLLGLVRRRTHTSPRAA